MSVARSDADSGEVVVEQVCEIVSGLVMESFRGEEKGFFTSTLYEGKPLWMLEDR